MQVTVVQYSLRLMKRSYEKVKRFWAA